MHEDEKPKFVFLGHVMGLEQFHNLSVGLSMSQKTIELNYLHFAERIMLEAADPRNNSSVKNEIARMVLPFIYLTELHGERLSLLMLALFDDPIAKMNMAMLMRDGKVGYTSDTIAQIVLLAKCHEIRRNNAPLIALLH